jgi:hypothetical protein
VNRMIDIGGHPTWVDDRQRDRSGARRHRSASAFSNAFHSSSVRPVIGAQVSNSSPASVQKSNSALGPQWKPSTVDVLNDVVIVPVVTSRR